MILEPTLRVILHCSRCNTPFKDDDYDAIATWTKEALEAAFPEEFNPELDVQGWIRVGDRVLCFDCWERADAEDEAAGVVEKPPLPAVDAAKVTRAQDAYPSYEVVKAAFDSVGDDGWRHVTGTAGAA